VYCEGNWGTNVDNLVFHNWRVEDFDVLSLSASGLEHRVGADFGYVDPTTVIDSLYDAANKRIYVFNEFYKRGCQLDEVAAAMNEMKIGKTKIFMDAAEPRSIDYFRKQGFNAVPCIKG
jgi:phage terminase large subunit